jgi:hypothetical protein
MIKERHVANAMPVYSEKMASITPTYKTQPNINKYLKKLTLFECF